MPKKEQPSMLRKAMKEQRKQYPKELTDQEKKIMSAMERGDEMYVDKETGQKISLPAKALEAPDFMVDLLMSGGIAGMASKLGKKAAKSIASKLGKKAPTGNTKVPRGKPGGGQIRAQDRKAGRELRNDPDVRARKQQVKDIKTTQRKNTRRVKKINKLARGVERRESLKETLQDLKRSLQQVLKEGNKTHAQMYRGEIKDVEKRLRRQKMAKRLRNAKNRTPQDKD